MTPYSFLFVLIWLFLCPLVSLAKSLSILFILSKKQFLVMLILYVILFVSTLLISVLSLMIIFCHLLLLNVFACFCLVLKSTQSHQKKFENPLHSYEGKLTQQCPWDWAALGCFLPWVWSGFALSALLCQRHFPLVMEICRDDFSFPHLESAMFGFTLSKARHLEFSCV